MIVKHQNKTPKIDKSSYVAPNALICGDVKIGKNARIMFGAQIIAENSPVEIADNCIILENAVIRATKGHPVLIGNNCLIGPVTHLAGCILEDNVFIATGASVFHGAVLRKGAEIRINGIVHLKSIVPENTVVPINWIAVGNPIQLFSPEKHDEIREIQESLNFPEFVYGLSRSHNEDSIMPSVCEIMVERLGEHLDDKLFISDLD